MIPQQILNSLNDFFTKQLSHLKGDILQHSLSGGSINEAFRITKGKERFFLKYNHADLYPGMFEKEAAGLKMLHTTGEIDVPEVIHFGNSGDYSFLLLTYIEQGKEKSNFWMEFAKQLAALHSHKAPQFGLDYDNYMGSLYQHNTFHNRWINFLSKNGLKGRCGWRAIEEIFLLPMFPLSSVYIKNWKRYFQKLSLHLFMAICGAVIL